MPLIRRLSINLKLPLLVAGLLLAAVAIYATIAYRQVSTAARIEAEDRMSKVAGQLADMVSQQGGFFRTRLTKLASDSALQGFPDDTTAAAVARAVAVLSQLTRDTSDHVTAEVRGADGKLLAAPPVRDPILLESADSAPSRPDSVALGRLFLFRDTVFYEVTAPLPGHRGWVVQRRMIANSAENVAKISQLIGTNAQLLLGNNEGPSIWTDYIRHVDRPGVDDSAAAYQRNGLKRIGGFAASPNTPWMMGADVPWNVVMAAPHALLRRFIILALIIIAVGIVAGWLLSRQMTRPLGELTRAAEDIASGRREELPVATTRPDEIGRLNAAFRTMLDRVREGQNQVRGTLETLRAVFHASPLPIIALNREERVEFWNLAAERVFGWPAEQVIGKPLPFIPDHLREESDRLWDDSFAGKVTTGLEVRRQRRDGEMLDLRLTVSAIYGDHEEPTGVVAVYEDVTDRRRMEDHLRHIQRLDAIGKLAGGVAHDFNNLLTVILTEAELGMVAQPEEGREALGAVRQTAERAAALTRQLLAFARRQPLKAEVFDLGDLVSDLEKMLRRLIGDHITLETRIADGLWPVKADRGQVEQVITNLVVNARDAMPNGGSVAISAANLTVKPEETEGKPELEPGDWIVLTISDTGTGMSDEVKARLFEPFFTTKEAGKGTGLGLATCHGIVQQSGGRIQVQSVVGKGTIFTVQLPRVLSLDGAIDRATERPEEGEAGGIILLVEDYSELRSVAGRVLSRAGYQVISAASGEEALKLVDAGLRPDLLVSDIGLPGINGVRLAEAIRGVHPQLKVLLVSGSKDYEHLLKSIDERSFLEKPYRVEELVRGVRAMFRKPVARAS